MSTTTFTPIATEERLPPTQQVNTDDGTPDLSQETLSENFGWTDGPTPHARYHNCDMRQIPNINQLDFGILCIALPPGFLTPTAKRYINNDTLDKV